MTGAAGYLVDSIAYAARRRSHDRADAATVADLQVPGADLGLPAGLSVEWLGVAGFALRCEGTTVLVDPYATRLPTRDLLRRRVVPASRAAADRWIPRADAVLVGHTHFDHALDVPAIAARDGAPVYGGESAARLMRLHGLGAQAVVVEPHRRVEIGPFSVAFVPSVHSKLALGLAVPSAGEITCDSLDALTPQAYRCGQVWGIEIEVAGSRLYHQGSADLLDDEIGRHAADVFLCGIAGRQFTRDYARRVLTRLQPHTVVCSHHDDFFRPLDAPFGFAFGVDVARFPDEVAEVSRDIRVVSLPPPAPRAST